MKRVSTAMEQALVFLSRKDYSRRELKIALKKNGCSEAEIEETVERLGEWCYVDDRVFAASEIDRFLQDGKSRAFIKYRLELSGVPALIIEEEMAKNYPPEKEEEVLRTWWNKLREGLRGREPLVKEKTRWARRLLTAGFPRESVQACFEEDRRPDYDS